MAPGRRWRRAKVVKITDKLTPPDQGDDLPGSGDRQRAWRDASSAAVLTRVWLPAESSVQAKSPADNLTIKKKVSQSGGDKAKNDADGESSRKRRKVGHPVLPAEIDVIFNHGTHGKLRVDYPSTAYF